jgi:hypothetical protein
LPHPLAMVTRKLIAGVIAITLVGCGVGASIQNTVVKDSGSAATAAASSAVAIISSPNSIRQLDNTASSVASAAASGAVNEFLDAENTAKINAIVSKVSATLAQEVDAMRDDLLGEKTTALIKQIIAESFSELSTQIDVLVQKIKSAVGIAVPLIQPVEAKVETDAKKVERYAEIFGSAVTVLVAVFAFVSWRHRKRIEDLEQRLTDALTRPNLHS